MIVENRRARAHLDIPLIMMVFLMSIFGVLAVSVATYTTSSTSDASLLNHIVESSYALRQCLYVLVAAFIISVLVNIPFLVLRRLTPAIYALATALVLFTLVTNGAAGVRAWTDVLWGYTIQPSEFIKLAMVLMLARILSRYEKPLSEPRHFLEIGAMVAVPSIIILASGEMGSLLVIIFMFAVMLFFSGTDIRLLVFFGIAGALLLLAIYGYYTVFNSDSYRLARILAFINPEMYSSNDAYQQLQSMTCIGSGGLWGIGMYVDGAWSQLGYVPADWTDFIFATIGEAWGFVGCMGVVLMYLLIIFRMYYLARYTYDKFGMLVIVGIMAMLLFHVFENVGMTIGKMPITGIPLPFLSYGGSNMVTNMGGIGLVLNVTKNRSLTSSITTPQPMASMSVYKRHPRK